MMKYDAFISHSSEDKEKFVKPLADLLNQKGFHIWYDEFTLKVGDSLRKSIDTGLLNSKFGIIVLSKSFFKKNWPIYELDSIVTLDMENPGIILPIWHNIGKSEIIEFSPALGDKIALDISKMNLNEIVNKLEDKLGEEKFSLNKNFELKKSQRKYPINPADRERGFHTVLSDQTDKIINKKETIIRTKLIIQPFDKSLSEFHFHHWQDLKGNMEFIRANILEELTGKIIDNETVIEQNDGHKFRLRCIFELAQKTPLNIIFEIRTTNYFPNLFTTGTGYTEFHIRYPISTFCYHLFMPNKKDYQNIDLYLNEKELKFEKSTSEISVFYRKQNAKVGDKLNFRIDNKNIK